MVWEEAEGEATLQRGVDRLAAGAVSPYDLAQEILAGLKKEMGNGDA
jgi:hypothetical protein